MASGNILTDIRVALNNIHDANEDEIDRRSINKSIRCIKLAIVYFELNELKLAKTKLEEANKVFCEGGNFKRREG